MMQRSCKATNAAGRADGRRPFGLGRRATQLFVRLVEGSTRYLLLALLDLLARRSQRGTCEF
jgi:hypothetical protein